MRDEIAQFSQELVHFWDVGDGSRSRPSASMAIRSVVRSRHLTALREEVR